MTGKSKMCNHGMKVQKSSTGFCLLTTVQKTSHGEIRCGDVLDDRSGASFHEMDSEFAKTESSFLGPEVGSNFCN
jgi:hypothetical protein